MKSSLRLAKIRLINWHNFIDETIDVAGSLFLIGDNGAGKTTLLDAVHCALTGDLKVELNAAARVGGRAGTGRNLQGLVLGQDLERGYRRPDGAVAYAALEFRQPAGDGDRAGERPLSIGMGIYVASRDSRPEKWGFIKSVPIEQIPLTLPAADARRPADRSELLGALGHGHVHDIGRYRTRVGERLFGSRARFEQVAAFLHAGKSYRELVAKTANFSDLIAELLPQPDLETFHEVRRALEAIERTRADLDGLEQELARLRSLLFELQEVAKTREAIARYDYLAADHAYAEAREEVEALSARHARAGEELAAAGEARDSGRAHLAALDTEIERLRSSGGMEIVERHREVGRLLERQRGFLEQLASQLRELREETQRGEDDQEQVVADLAAWAGEAATAFGELLMGLREAVPRADFGEAHDLLGQLSDLAADVRSAEIQIGDADDRRRRLRRELDRQAAAARERRRAARQETAAALRQWRTTRRSLWALHEQGESAPPVEGLREAEQLLREAGIEAVALYRMLEPRETLTPEDAGLIERALGRRLLGTLVVPAVDHARALELVLSQAPGIAVADPAAVGKGIEAALSAGSPTGGTPAPSGPAGPAVAPCVLDQVEIASQDPSAAAYLRHHVGELTWRNEPWPGAGSGQADPLPVLTAGGYLHHARRRMRVPAGPAIWLGQRARRRVFEQAVAALEREAAEARVRADEQRAASAEAERIARRLEEAARFADRLDLIGITALVHRRDELGRALERLGADLAVRRTEAARASLEETALARDLETLAMTMKAQGLETLSDRIGELDRERAGVRRELDELGEDLGRRRERQAQLATGLEDARGRAAVRLEELARVRDRLLRLVLPEQAADLDDYVMRTRRGRQIKAANLGALREEAVRRGAVVHERITQGEGIRHPLLWQKYAFRYEEEANALRDSAGVTIDEITETLQAQVDELNEVLRGRNEELLERIVLQELAGVLRREVDDLRSTVQGVNHLMGDLTFGRTRYRIEPRLKPEMSRLHTLLKESSRLSSGAREELRDYFAARLAEFGDPSGDSLPAFLDYRLWFDFHLRMSTLDDDGVELSQERLRQGSGGEQAVPAYLLLFCLTKLLYDGIEARVRLLIIDEAFYGIDGGRRNELLRFCGRASIDLVVATPEVDGVTEALPSSTTVLIEKTPEADIFLFDLHYRQKVPDLFDSGKDPQPEELVVGVPDGRPSP